MKPNDETIEAYKMMASQSQVKMEYCIRKHLETTCPKYIGNEDKFDRCIDYLTECAKEILDGKNGDVADDVCYKICRDYFNDEIWKAEDEAEAREKAEREKRDAERKSRMAKKKRTATITATISDAKHDDRIDIHDVPTVAQAAPKKLEGQLDLFAALGV